MGYDSVGDAEPTNDIVEDEVGYISPGSLLHGYFLDPLSIAFCHR